MAQIIPIRRKSLKDKHKGKALCRHGHHKWKVDKAKSFDVREGRLVTVYRCTRCEKMEVKSH